MSAAYVANLIAIIFYGLAVGLFTILGVVELSDNIPASLAFGSAAFVAILGVGNTILASAKWK